jgi:hypothetical protein
MDEAGIDAWNADHAATARCRDALPDRHAAAAFQLYSGQR